MESYMIGTPAYGSQPPKWWARLNAITMNSEAFGLRFEGYIVESTAGVDYNQNLIVEKFLETDHDWLFWVEQDTVPPLVGLGRLYETFQPIVSALYVGKAHPFRPIAYYRRGDGLYQSIDNFTPGELLPVAAPGMGCVLIQRKVFEDYKENFVHLQRASGGSIAIHKDRIKGKIHQDRKNRHDGEVRNGVLQERLYYPKKEDTPFPFFAAEWGRTSDLYFFENVREMGYQPFVDTSIVCDHLGPKAFNMEDHKKQLFYERFGKHTPPELLHVDS